MSAKQLIKDYIAANPKAKPKEIALACKCSVHTVYNFRASLKTKPESKPTPSDAKLLSKREREIKVLLETESVLLRRIKRLTDDNHLYAERELKLKGVIDYLEAKVEDGLAV